MKYVRRKIKAEYVGMFILSLVFFWGIDVDGRVYIPFVAVLWISILVRYKIVPNRRFYYSSIILAIINLGVYVFSKLVLRNYPLDIHAGFIRILANLTLDAWLLTGYFTFLIGLMFWTKFKRGDNEKIDSKSPDFSDDDGNNNNHGSASADSTGVELVLFQERKNDAEKIKQYLGRFSTIGIEGEWGSGKTVLMENVIADWQKMNLRRNQTVRLR